MLMLGRLLTNHRYIQSVIINVYLICSTLLEVRDMEGNNDKLLTLSYEDQEFSVSLNDSNVDQSSFISLSVMGGSDILWKTVYLTLNSTTISLMSNSESNSTSISSLSFISNWSGARIGGDFTGLVQDIIVYTPQLENSRVPSAPSFLPQCFCFDEAATGDRCQDGAESIDR